MSDIVVTVPKRLWDEWMAEGDLPGEPWSGYDSHFWIASPPPYVGLAIGDARVYVVAHGKLRGYAPLIAIEAPCRMRPSVRCFLRRGGAVAVTIPDPIRGFQGWRYRWWAREDEVPFPDWRTP